LLISDFGLWNVIMSLRYQTYPPTPEQYFALFETTGWNDEYHLTPHDLAKVLTNSWYTVSAYSVARPRTSATSSCSAPPASANFTSGTVLSRDRTMRRGCSIEAARPVRWVTDAMEFLDHMTHLTGLGHVSYPPRAP
jgi:hypothetical protein